MMPNTPKPVIVNRMATSFLLLACMLAMSPSGWSQTARQVAQSTFPSVVLIVMQDSQGQPIAQASGFFVGSNVVATNLHVIEGAAKGFAKLIDQKKEYEITGSVGIDETHDLALLSLPTAEGKPVGMGNSSDTSVGDEIYAVGNPLGLEGTFSQGIVSGIRRVGDNSIFQITAPISPGSSGGPVLNAEGKVIGVAAATFSGGQNLNFAIPSAYLAVLMASTKPRIALSATAKLSSRKSALDSFGGRSTEGVIGTNFLWGDRHSFSFTLKNQISAPVKNITCLVIFYDEKGEPLDFTLVTHEDIIPAGLAKRVDGYSRWDVENLEKRFEIRVIDFLIVE